MNVMPMQASEQSAAPAHSRYLTLADPVLALGAVGLVACSVVTLRSVVGTGVAERQGLYGVLGAAVAIVLARIDYSRLREYKYGFYAILIGLNLVVFGMPQVAGARRWIPLPFIQIQPSEFGKILLILALSAFVVDRSRRLYEWRTTARIMVLSLAAALVVIPQPDLGTGMVFVVVGFATLFVVGTSWKHLLALVAMFAVAGALVLGLAPAAGVHVVKTYQMQRLTTFLHPSKTCNTETDQTCYQLKEAEIAIGSGQKTGRGINATQTRLNFLPANTTDFIFAAVGEMYGFAGAALVLSLYALLIWRGLRILTMSKNLYGTAIAGGILAMLMFQVFLNAGMTIGIMPVAGVPLPLMSYGGSSVLVTFIAVGLLQSIYIQARRTSAAKARSLIS
jgi:rod shape determining protein RodA